MHHVGGLHVKQELIGSSLHQLKSTWRHPSLLCFSCAQRWVIVAVYQSHTAFPLDHLKHLLAHTKPFPLVVVCEQWSGWIGMVWIIIVKDLGKHLWGLTLRKWWLAQVCHPELCQSEWSLKSRSRRMQFYKGAILCSLLILKSLNIWKHQYRISHTVIIHSLKNTSPSQCPLLSWRASVSAVTSQSPHYCLCVDGVCTTSAGDYGGQCLLLVCFTTMDKIPDQSKNTSACGTWQFVYITLNPAVSAHCSA